jgi:hypothetical protein
MSPAPALPTPFAEVRQVEVPFAGGLAVVGLPAVGDRPLFGEATLHRDHVALRTVLPAAVAPWPARAITPQRARDAVTAALPRARTGERPVEGYRRSGDALVPVYQVDTLLPGPSAWVFWVSAADGVVVGGARTSRDATGRVYGGSPFTSGTELVQLPGVEGALLDGPYVRARSCDEWTVGGSLFSLTSCEALGRHAVADQGGDFLFFPAPASYVDPFAEVHLYFHADHFSRWLDDRYGLTFPYAPIWANANFPLANAFFGDFDLDGVPEISFGTDDPTGTDFAYDADVVYHELGHAVVGEWAPTLPFLGADEYGLEWAGGAVNEGIADVFSMLHSPDPLTGEFAGSAFGERAIRDLERPRRCPDDLKGEVHADGEIFASFGWQLVSDPLVGPDLVAELLAGTIPQLGSDVSWDGIGRAVHAAADDLRRVGFTGDRAHEAILAHLEASGMEGCGRVIPLDGGAVADLLLVNGGLLGELARLPGGAQLSLDVPADAEGVLVTVSGFSAVDGMGWAVYGRWGEPVEHTFTVVDLLGIGFATPVVTDDTFVVEGGDAPSLSFGLGGPDALEVRPGETLYLSVASVNQGSLTLLDFQYGRIAVEAAPVGPPELPSPSGCTHGPGAPAVLGIAAVIARRRRAAVRSAR